MSHLPPSFSCLECGKKFMQASNLKTHMKIHQGVLNEVCKYCNKGYATKNGRSDHIIQRHFAKIHCEVTGCSSLLSFKSKYKKHLKTVHKKDDQVLIESLLIKLEKLKPNFQQLKYV